MKHKTPLLVGLVLLCFFCNSFALALITEPDMGRTPLLNAMNHAKKSIKLVIYGLTDPLMVDGLIRAKARGVDVKVILEKHPYRHANQNSQAHKALYTANILVKSGDSNVHYTHQKTMIIDDKTAYLMTLNFTRSAFGAQRNFALPIDDPTLVVKIITQFKKDWENQKTQPSTDKKLVWSPGDTTERIMRMIHQRKGMLLVYAPSIAIYKMVGALAREARHRKVDIITSGPALYRNKGKLCYLSRHHVNVRILKKVFPHAKMVLSEDSRGTDYFLGSQNMTENSMHRNRELGIIETNKFIGNQLASAFYTDWQRAIPLKNC